MSGSLDDIHSSLSREDANAQGLMAVNQSKTKLSEAAKDKIKLTDLIDKTKATKDERDVDADEVSAELQVDEHGQPMLQTVEDKIYAELTLRHDDTGADNDQIFLVDGDSLLDEILHDPLLDWSHGGQFLHIIFALEQYVRRFQEDGRIFRFIFFHSFGSIAWANAPLVQLVRERVIQHLRALNVALNEFENWWDQPFTEFLERVDPAFILVGDGNKPSSSSASTSSSSSSSSSITSLTSHLAQLSLAAPVLTPNEIICSMTLYLLSHHFRVIRLTELSFAGNCMYGFQFAMHQLYKNQLRAVGGYKPHEALKAKTEQPIYRIDAAKKYDASLASQMASSVKEARLQHVAYALTKALESNSSAENIEVAKSIAVATVLSKHLALDGRALVWTKEDRNQSLKYASFLATFHQQLLIASIGSGANDSTKPTAGELDIFDGRLVAFVLYALHQQNITTLGWSGSMESELLAAWACIKSVVPSAGDFLPLAQLKSIAAPGVVDVDENQLAEEARKKLSQVQSLAPAKKATSASSPSPPAASAAAAPVKAAPAEEEEVPDSWEDEDVDDVPPPKPAAPVAAPPAAAAAPAEDEFDSWEDAADEEEKKAVEPEPVAAAAAPAVTEKVAESDSSEDVASLEAATLTPVIELDNKLVKEICAEVDTRLSAFGLLEQPDGPAVSLTSFAARYAIREGIVLDDEMDDEPKSVGLLTRREQRQASNMINYWEQYSKSLVGGRLVLREVVVAPTIKEDEQEDEEEEKKESGAKGKKGKDAAKDKPKKAGKPGAGGGKKGAKVEKESIKDKIRREVEEQQRLKDIKKIQGKVNIAATMSTLPGKIAKLDSELEQMGEATAIPAMLTLLDWCLEHWKQSKPKSDIEPAIKVFVMVHDIYRRFKQFLQPDEFKKIITVMIQIGFEEAAQRMSKEFVKESEGKFTDAQVKVDLKSSSFPATLIGLGYNRFQLEYCGPWMLRNVESAPDSRVTAFMPDKWQRQLLDVADANQSALIVAPTSSGKTFISYYVMKNVIAANKLIERSSERGVVVYVAPNKALVNQVSADVYQRYGLVFGQATGDFSDKALSSEVLITVPSVLEQLLLSPHRESWVKKLRWVIFDEVHLISSAGEGSIWERCLSLIRCPFLALSATVGNPSDFYGWLSRLDALRSRKVHLIVHETRWSDLEKGVFLPIDPSVPSHNPESMKKFDLRSMQLVPSQWASVRLHPCAAIGTQLQDTNEFPKEVSFTPRDSLSLYDALNKFAGNLNDTLKKDLQSLAPDTFFPELLIVKARAMEYEARLKRTLQNWLEAGLHKEVGQVMGALTGDLAQRITTMEGNASVGQSCYDTAFLRKHFFSLLLELYSRDQLPGIVFSNDPELCVKLCIDTVEKLEELESKTLEQESNSEEARAKIKQKAAQLKALKKKRDMKMKNKQAEEEAREADEFEDVEVETETDEYTVDPRFSFIDETEKMDKKELEYWVKRTLYKTQWKKSHPLIRALYRGIGVHHSGLVKQYRDLVETLFRGKHLKVVVATSTLALGVNMPARSTILAGDSKLLTPLQYRQMSGRAGRRGYDNVGNVIFFGIPPRKIFRLLKSPLNSLRGHFPVDNTLALRMMHRYSAATDKKDAMASLAPLLREPFFRDNWSGSKLLKQIEYHFRFNMDSLYSRALINTKGESYGLAALATHMHATDPSNFGLIALLESGHLHSMCKGFDIDKNRVARELLTLLAHLFYRVPIPAYSTRANFRASSANMIILPPIDPDVKKIIAEYNTESLKEFSNYLKTFAQIELGKVPAPESDATPSSAHSSLVDGPVHVHEHFYQLPTSGINFPWVWSKSSPPESSLMSTLATAKVQIEARSPFVALSGHSDSFESARSLAETLRNGIFLDTKLIPVCMEDLDSRGNELQLNAYVVDFYVKQHFHSLVRDNRLSDAFVWGLLKNWDSLLENITLALRTLSVDPENDILIKAFDHLTSTFKQSFSAIVNV